MTAIRFDGQVAVVTGAGGGLGRAYALELARRGAKVVVNDLGSGKDGKGVASKPADEVVREIIEGGGDAMADYGSVTDRGAMEQMVANAVTRWGRLDVLIANAGVIRDKSFAKQTIDDFLFVLDVHLKGTILAAKAAWQTMIDQGYGRIVFTTSGSGLYGNFGQSNYAAAKLGVVGLMNTLRLEGIRHGIHVNALGPGAATRMTEGIMDEATQAHMRPARVVPAAIYLCSRDAPNGTILNAAAGAFSISKIVETPGIILEEGGTAEDLRDRWDEVSNASGARAYGSVPEQAAATFARLGSTQSA